jgi:hypothetical protein
VGSDHRAVPPGRPGREGADHRGAGRGLGGDELPPIVGQQEIIELFHLPAQGNLATTIATGRFPEPDWLLSGSMLWMLDTVLDAVPKLRESARSLPWDVDEAVVAALRDGTYDGPGSHVLTRGRHARKGL